MSLETQIGRTRIESVGQPALYLGCAIFLRNGQQTVLSDETFRLVAFSGQESISTLFEFQLTLHGNTEVPSRSPIIFRDLLGCRVSFVVARPVSSSGEAGAQYTGAERIRQALRGGQCPGVAVFSGMVASFAMLEPGVYRLTVRPTLWKLTLANRYRVYAGKNVRDVIREVCEPHGVNIAFRNLKDLGTYNLATSRVQDWLQAGESDYEFLERLMGKAHLYYAFEHTAENHTVVFANDTDYPRILGNPSLRYTGTSTEALGLHQDDLITEYSYEQTLSQSGVRGAFTRQEEAWEQDGVATFQTFVTPVGESAAEPMFNLHKVYQYGVTDQLATEFTTLAASALQTAASQFTGKSLCTQMRCGYQFQTLESLDRSSVASPVRPTLDGHWFVLNQVRHQASLDGIYSNEFVALAASGPLVPFSVHDTQLGAVLAKVVDGGTRQESMNWRYCTPNEFDPQNSSVTDAASTPESTVLNGVYVRLASDAESAPPVWVKLAPHMQSAPEIGALVLVARANDESELPEIQNIIEAPGQMTVKPQRWTTDTRVGSNYSTSYGDSMSIRYGEQSSVDLPAAFHRLEEQYDQGHFRDVSYSKGARYSYDTSNGGRDDMLSSSESVGSTYSTSKGKERQSDEDFDHTVSNQKVGSSEAYSMTTGRSYSESTVGSQENRHTVQGDSLNYETVNGRSYSETTHGSSETHNIIQDASASFDTFEGGRYTEQTVLGNSTSLTTVAGVDLSTSVIESSIRSNTVGISDDTSLTVMSSSTADVGETIDMRSTGISTTVHSTDDAFDLSFYGVVTRGEFSDVSITLKLEPDGLVAEIKGETVELPEMKIIL